MDMAALPTEITYLAWGVVLVLLQVVLQASTASLEFGPAYAAGPRDDNRRPQGVLAKRADRALRNLLETFPVFVALALALAVTDRTGGLGATGAMVWFWARVLFLPLMLSGIPFVRTVVWLASVVGLVLMLVRLLG